MLLHGCRQLYSLCHRRYRRTAEEEEEARSQSSNELFLSPLCTSLNLLYAERNCICYCISYY